MMEVLRRRLDWLEKRLEQGHEQMSVGGYNRMAAEASALKWALAKLAHEEEGTGHRTGDPASSEPERGHTGLEVRSKPCL